MAENPETLLTRRILKALRARGGLWRKKHGTRMQAATLDIIGCYRGIYVELEVKVPCRRNKATKRQKIIMRQVRDAGGIAEIVWTKRSATAILRAIEIMRPTNHTDATAVVTRIRETLDALDRRPQP